MELDRLKSQLQIAIPEELYKIEPGQIVLFVAQDGIDRRTSTKLMGFFQYLRKLYKDNNVNVSIVPTDNELLIDKLAGRNPQETGNPYKIAISSWDTLAGFAADYFGEDVDEIIKRIPKGPAFPPFSISATELPIIVHLAPENTSSITQGESYGGFDPYGMELKQVKPEKGSKAEKALISRMERKMEKVLRECAIFDIEIDNDKIKKRVKNSLKSNIKYNLSLDIKGIKEGPISFCTVCDIYVADDENYKLELTAVEKATYLAFLLYEKGIRISATTEDFRRTSQKIYNQLPDFDKCEKTAGGILDKGSVDPKKYTDTLRGYISTIREEIDSKIAHPLIAQDFAIEGFKDKEFGIAMSTPEIRKQIKEAFAL